MITSRSILLLIIISILISCTDSNTQKESSPSYEVKYYGALKNIMHEGNINPNFDLKEIKKTKNLYALGAVNHLKGEIQIFNSESFNTFVNDNSLEFDKSLDSKATLLVYSIVKEWESLKIPENISQYDQLEKFITEIAQEYNIDINKPFPFLINGTIAELDWHVINWKNGDTEHSHEKHINSGLHGTIQNEKVDILGFYSNSHHTIFTHHSTNMHLHFKMQDNSLAGHIDNLKLGSNITLKLPSNTK